MSNVGKVFENNFKASVPSDVMYYRPPDAAQSFNMDKSSKLRFSAHSPCDCMMFNGMYLWTLELKTVGTDSITFEREKGDPKRVIHYYQVESLKKFSKFKNVISGFILNFRKSENTYFFPIEAWDEFVNSIDKVSFNERDLSKCSSIIKIDSRKLKVNYRYDVDNFMKNSIAQIQEYTEE